MFASPILAGSFNLVKGRVVVIWSAAKRDTVSFVDSRFRERFTVKKMLIWNKMPAWFVQNK